MSFFKRFKRIKRGTSVLAAVLMALGLFTFTAGMAQAAVSGIGISVDFSNSAGTSGVADFSSTLAFDVPVRVEVTSGGIATDTPQKNLPAHGAVTIDANVPAGATAVPQFFDGVGWENLDGSYTNKTAAGPIEVAPPVAVANPNGTYTIPATAHWSVSVNGGLVPLDKAVTLPGNGAASVTIQYVADKGYGHNGDRYATQTLTLVVADRNEHKIPICHRLGNGGYELIPAISVAAVVSGHIHHTDDIWGPFDYVDAKGNVVNVPAQGDQSILAGQCKVYIEPVPTPVPTSTGTTPPVNETPAPSTTASAPAAVPSTTTSAPAPAPSTTTPAPAAASSTTTQPAVSAANQQSTTPSAQLGYVFNTAAKGPASQSSGIWLLLSGAALMAISAALMVRKVRLGRKH